MGAKTALFAWDVFFRTVTTRPNIVSGVFLFAFVNGISEVVFRSIESNGVAGALAGTFGISVIVYVGLGLALLSLSKDAEKSVPFKDGKLLWIPVALVLIPNPYLSWFAITSLALYERHHSECGTQRRRGATLMLGLTIPMFWGKIVFALFSSWILKGDALLVSTITQSATVGNMVALPHQTGYLLIAPACSSFANISLAVLCWLIFTEYSGRPRRPEDYVTCISACVNVVIVNVARISTIGLRPDLYGLLHGPVGATTASWLTAIVVLATCYYGVKRESVVGSSANYLVHSRNDPTST